MPLSPVRTQEIVAGFIQRQHQRHRTQPTNATPTQLRSLQSWLVVFWMNQDLRRKICHFLRLRGGRRGSRRETMRAYLVGRDQEMDKYEDPELQVSPRVRNHSRLNADDETRTWLNLTFLRR
jgi:hypothetical protein